MGRRALIGNRSSMQASTNRIIWKRFWRLKPAPYSAVNCLDSVETMFPVPKQFHSWGFAELPRIFARWTPKTFLHRAND